jgi:hypothetical protein
MKGPEMLLTDPGEKSQLKALEERFVAGAGVLNRPGGSPRPDAACWAVLGLRAAGGDSPVIAESRRLLAAMQSEDGRVALSPQYPAAYWPTPLAALAWQGATEYQEPRDRAVRFLLNLDEIKIPDATGPEGGHDVTIKGWPWIVGTHPWVEPTSYVTMALRACGYATHSRIQDAIRMLLDRQLPSGGWNSGNTITFGLETRPAPESTGLALQALVGLVPKTAVAHSIAYMQAELPFLHTPISVSWAILGLHAWEEIVDQPQERIRQVLARQEKLGPHDTASLSLLLLAWHCSQGLVPFFDRDPVQDKT